jgi:hypothetical protein
MPIPFSDVVANMRHPEGHSKDRIQRIIRIVDSRMTGPAWLRKNCQHVSYKGESFQWNIHIEEAISESEAKEIQDMYIKAGWPFARVTRVNPFNYEGHMTLVELSGVIDIF